MQPTRRTLLGVVVILAVLFILDLNQMNWLHQLVLPLCLSLGAYAMTQSLMAVAIATGTLALLHARLGSAFWIEAYAYPAVAALCLGFVAWTFITRFRDRIEATREARWTARRARSDESANPDETN